EDFLRILRFFRIHAWYGRGDLDPEGLAACAAAKDGLARLSIERVAQEITRLLEAHMPLPALTAMKGTGVLAAILPEAEHLESLTRLNMMTLVVGRSADWVLRLCVLVGREPRTLEELARRLKLSNESRERLKALAANRVDIDADPG